MSQDDLPEWLKQLRDQQLGPSSPSPAEPAPLAEPAEPVAPAEQALPEAPAMTGAGELDELRERARAEPPVEERPQRTIPVISQLSPFQRFVLALMLFLNVSVLGCLFLMVTGKIMLAR